MVQKIVWILLAIAIIGGIVTVVLFFSMPTSEVVGIPNCTDALPDESCWKEPTYEGNYQSP